MSWVRLDDKFYQHPKVLGLSDKAFRLYVNSLCFTALNDLDGEIPPHALTSLRGNAKTAEELVKAVLWDTTSRASWVVHDYLKYNRSKADLDAERQAKVEAGRRGGLQKAASRGLAPVVAEPLAPANPSGTEDFYSRPVPSPTPSATDVAEPLAQAPKTRRRPIEPEDVERWQRENPDIDVPAMVADYRNWAGSSKHHDKVQGFENQLRLGFKRDQFRRNTNGQSGYGPRTNRQPNVTVAQPAKGPGRVPDLVVED